jgi:toxin ParE1/3/4
MRVRWTRKALKNLADEAEYVSRDSPQSSAKIADRIQKLIEHLVNDPSLGRPGRVPGTRELVVTGTPYLIPYRVRENRIEILRVFHASRKFPEEF